MKASRSIPFVFLSIWLILFGCDTKQSIESPSKNYFLKFYGNDGDQTGVDLVVNPDGSMVLFGTSKIKTGSPTDNTQFYVVKADPLGDTIWTRTFGGSLDEEAKDIELTSDGRIVVMGNSYSSAGNRDILIIILDQDGNKLDELLKGYQSITGTEGDEDGSSITETNDGFIVAGSTGDLHNLGFVREALFARFTDKPLGVYPPTWDIIPSFGQASESVATKIVQLANQDFYVFGYSKYAQGPVGDFNFWYFGLGQNGHTNTGVWTIGPSGGTSGTDERLGSVAVVPNQGGYLLNGITTSKSGDDDGYIAKLKDYPLGFSDSTDFDFAGKPLSIKLGASTGTRQASACVAGGTGYFVLYSETFNPGNNNLLLVKIGLDGQPIWQTIYGGAGDDLAGSVVELPDGKIAVVGTMAIGQVPGETKMVLIKVNKDGQFAD